MVALGPRLRDGRRTQERMMEVWDWDHYSEGYLDESREDRQTCSKVGKKLTGDPRSRKKGLTGPQRLIRPHVVRPGLGAFRAPSAQERLDTGGPLKESLLTKKESSIPKVKEQTNPGQA